MWLLPLPSSKAGGEGQVVPSCLRGFTHVYSLHHGEPGLLQKWHDDQFCFSLYTSESHLLSRWCILPHQWDVEVAGREQLLGTRGTAGCCPSPAAWGRCWPERRETRRGEMPPRRSWATVLTFLWVHLPLLVKGDVCMATQGFDTHRQTPARFNPADLGGQLLPQPSITWVSTTCAWKAQAENGSIAVKGRGFAWNPSWLAAPLWRTSCTVDVSFRLHRPPLSLTQGPDLWGAPSLTCRKRTPCLGQGKSQGPWSTWLDLLLLQKVLQQQEHCTSRGL